MKDYMLKNYYYFVLIACTLSNYSLAMQLPLDPKDYDPAKSCLFAIKSGTVCPGLQQVRYEQMWQELSKAYVNSSYVIPASVREEPLVRPLLTPTGQLTEFARNTYKEVTDIPFKYFCRSRSSTHQ